MRRLCLYLFSGGDAVCQLLSDPVECTGLIRRRRPSRHTDQDDPTRLAGQRRAAC